MLFTVIVSLAICTFSIFTFFGYKKIDARFMSHSIIAIALFWLGMAGTWFATAGTDFFQYQHESSSAIVMTYILQIFVGASLVAAAYFFEEVLFASRARIFVLAVYGIWCGLFIYSLFLYGVKPRAESFFVGQILTSRITLALFTVGFLPLWIGSIILFLRSITNALKLSEPIRRFQLLIGLAFVLVGAAGSVDETGIVYGWMVTVARLVTLIASIIAYMSIYELRKHDDMVIE